jgi:hypothetical protein
LPGEWQCASLSDPLSFTSQGANRGAQLPEIGGDCGISTNSLSKKIVTAQGKHALPPEFAFRSEFRIHSRECGVSFGAFESAT